MKSKGSVLKEIFSQKKYVWLFIISFIIFFSFFSYFLNLAVISGVAGFELFSVGQKIQLVIKSIYVDFWSGHSSFSIITSVVLSILLAVYVAILVYSGKKFAKLGGRGFGFFGLIVAIFGAGCASCGISVLLLLFGGAGAVGLSRILPFGGNELSVVGIILIAYAIYKIMCRLQKPNSCEI